jgi:hypothetical protein
MVRIGKHLTITSDHPFSLQLPAVSLLTNPPLPQPRLNVSQKVMATLVHYASAVQATVTVADRHATMLLVA